MRLKLDENVPQDIVPDIARLGHDVDTVLEEGLRGRPDADVWQAAQIEGRFLITQDLDFADILAYPPGAHAGVLVLRLGDASRRTIAGSWTCSPPPRSQNGAAASSSRRARSCACGGPRRAHDRPQSDAGTGCE